MPIAINGQTYYRTSEACQIAGISRATLARWLKAGVVKDAASKDRRGWRLFTREDVKRIRTEASRIEVHKQGRRGREARRSSPRPSRASQDFRKRRA